MARIKDLEVEWWPLSCSFGGMISRFLLVLAGLFVVGVVGTILLYVSVLTLVAVVAIVFGLLATLALGYMAGSAPIEPPRAKRPSNVTAIDAPRDVLWFPEIVSENVTAKNRTERMTGSERVSSQHRLRPMF
jgi:hypothetical protein